MKLAILCGFTGTVFLIDAPALLAGALLAVLALYLLPGARFLVAGLKRLTPLWPFLAIVLVWHLLNGEYRDGLMIGLRLVATVALANLVTMTTRLDDLANIVSRGAAPFDRLGGNSKGVGIAVALVVRFTPVLAQKGNLLFESWRSRSPRRPGWRIVTPFVTLALDDAERVAEALKARGGV